MRTPSIPATLLCALLGATSFACGDDATPGDGADEAGEATETDDEVGESAGSECDPGDEQPCECPDGGQGSQMCTDTGWGECTDCVPPSECGNGVCEDDELCDECVEDCGICLDCAEAPSCEQAAIPDGIETHLEALDVPLPGEEEGEGGSLIVELQARVAGHDEGVRVVVAALDPEAVPGEHPFVPKLRQIFADYPEQAAAVRRQLARAGVDSVPSYRAAHPELRVGEGANRSPSSTPSLTPGPAEAPGDCEDPKLRLRVAKIVVHDEADLVFKDTIYCAVIAEAMPGAEIRVTPKTFALDNGDEYTFSLAEGVVWGQVGEPVAPQGSLAMTYNCLEGDGTGAFEEFLDAIANGAEGVGIIPGANGWVIPVIGLAAEIISAALALETDDHLFNASQIIPANLQLEMTPGVWWSVERDGVFMLKPWHWELRMEAWGCTDDGILEG